jgi:hypothetical protein
LTGTARYASAHTLQGIEQSRRDDMESLGYTLLYLLKSHLPWIGLPATNRKEKYMKILRLKQTIPLEQLCSDLPQEFTEYIQIVRNLTYPEEPPYFHLKSIFRNIFLSQQFLFDYNYDWSVATPPLQPLESPTSTEEQQPLIKETLVLPKTRPGLLRKLHIPVQRMKTHQQKIQAIKFCRFSKNKLPLNFLKALVYYFQEKERADRFF